MDVVINLSDRQDGAGFYYGYAKIGGNASKEFDSVRVDLKPPKDEGESWIAYVEGEEVGRADSSPEAELILIENIQSS